MRTSSVNPVLIALSVSSVGTLVLFFCGNGMLRMAGEALLNPYMVRCVAFVMLLFTEMLVAVLLSHLMQLGKGSILLLILLTITSGVPLGVVGMFVQYKSGGAIAAYTEGLGRRLRSGLGNVGDALRHLGEQIEEGQSVRVDLADTRFGHVFSGKTGLVSVVKNDHATGAANLLLHVSYNWGDVVVETASLRNRKLVPGKCSIPLTNGVVLNVMF